LFASHVLQHGTQEGIALENPAGCCRRANCRNVTFLLLLWSDSYQSRKELDEWIPSLSKLLPCCGAFWWWVEGTKQTCRGMAINASRN